MRQGLSGFNVKRKGDTVIKSTTGEESSLRLFHDAFKQRNSAGNINPLAAVPIKKMERTKESFSFEMPYMGIDLRASYLNPEQLKTLKLALNSYFYRRQESVVSGLNDLIIEEVKRIKDFVREIHGADESDLILFSDFMCPKNYYPKGYCHGDLGLRNMFLVSKKIYVSDFTRSFIESPLIDLIALEFSSNGIEQKEKQQIFKEIKSKFDENFLEQYDMIKKVKELQWKYRA